MAKFIDIIKIIATIAAIFYVLDHVTAYLNYLIWGITA